VVMGGKWGRKISISFLGLVFAVFSLGIIVSGNHRREGGHVRHIISSPTCADYRIYSQGAWRSDMMVNRTAISMLREYYDFRRGQITADQLRQFAKESEAELKDLEQHSAHQLVPASYIQFNQEVKFVTHAEIQTIGYLTQSRGILTDALADQLYRIIVQFHGLERHQPKVIQRG
jgi:hypothetical protein